MAVAGVAFSLAAAWDTVRQRVAAAVVVASSGTPFAAAALA